MSVSALGADGVSGSAVRAGGNVVVRVATAPNGFVKRKLIKIMSFRANITSCALMNVVCFGSALAPCSL